LRSIYHKEVEGTSIPAKKNVKYADGQYKERDIIVFLTRESYKDENYFVEAVIITSNQVDSLSLYYALDNEGVSRQVMSMLPMEELKPEHVQITIDKIDDRQVATAFLKFKGYRSDDIEEKDIEPEDTIQSLQQYFYNSLVRELNYVYREASVPAKKNVKYAVEEKSLSYNIGDIIYVLYGDWGTPQLIIGKKGEHQYSFETYDYSLLEMDGYSRVVNEDGVHGLFTKDKIYFEISEKDDDGRRRAIPYAFVGGRKLEITGPWVGEKHNIDITKDMTLTLVPDDKITIERMRNIVWYRIVSYFHQAIEKQKKSNWGLPWDVTIRSAWQKKQKTIYAKNEKGQLVLAIDIDGTTLEYDGHYEKGVFGPPMENAVKVINELHEDGVYIIFHTARDEDERDALRKHLARYKFQYDELVMGKPKADMYVDDKALQFKQKIK